LPRRQFQGGARLQGGLQKIKKPGRRSAAVVISGVPDELPDGRCRDKDPPGTAVSQAELLQRFVVYLEKISDLSLPVSSDKSCMIRVLVVGFIVTGCFKFH